MPLLRSDRWGEREMPNGRKQPIWGGIPIVLAGLLYAWSLVFSWGGEPFLIVAMLTLFGVGLFNSASAAAAAPNWCDPFKVRLHGAGKQESPERDLWLHTQTQRGRSIRNVLFSVLIAAFALFVLNHMTGTILCRPEQKAANTDQSKSKTLAPAESPTQTPAPSPTPTRAGRCEVLDWKSHADRLGDGGLTYPTKVNDNFSGIALTRGISPSLLGPKNLAAAFKADVALANAMTVSEGRLLTIEEISQKLSITPAQVASRFATTPLLENQSLRIPTDRPYDSRQWADWLLWSLIGMAAYLLIETARHLRNVAHGEGDFVAETSWYWTQLATGPLIAFVILLLFVHINVDLLTGDETALEVNLHKYPSDLLIVPAFLLGFYSRVTREVLDQIMRRIFGAAWRAANGDFKILVKGQPGDDEVSSKVTLETEPPTVVTWSATAGTIDSAGVFTPPAVEAPTQVFVTAIAADTNRAVTRTIMVVKHKFVIVATGNQKSELHLGQDQALAVNPPPQDPDKITWELVPPEPTGFSLEPKSGANVTLKTPEDAAPADPVTVKATYANLSRTLSLKVLPGLNLQATENGNPLSQGQKVAPGAKVRFKATADPDLSPEQWAQTKWSTDPAAAISLDSTTGQEVTGTVSATGSVLVENPAKSTARFGITV